jgi:hypothetical protein
MELGIYDKIIFFGNSTEIEQILSYSDLFLLPSETESFGLAALEAMASGVPVISSNAGGLSEVNENGVSGFLSDVGDVKNMTENALIVLKDKDTLLKYKENAKKVAEKFSIEKVLPLYEDLYQQAIELKKERNVILQIALIFFGTQGNFIFLFRINTFFFKVYRKQIVNNRAVFILVGFPILIHNYINCFIQFRTVF